MQHYFGTIADNKAIIDGKQIHHMIDVRRTAVGEQIEVSDDAQSYLCLVESVDPLSIKVLQKLEKKRELDIDLTIAWSVLKGDHNDLIVLKGTELGVARFVPFVSARSVVRPSEEEDNRIIRLRKKAEEGAKQCRRDVVPSVTAYKTLEQALAMPADVKLMAYENVAGEGEELFNAVASIPKHSRVLVLIGPEGGFTEEEANLATHYNFRFVSLGRRILRAETAAIYASAILGAASEAN